MAFSLLYYSTISFEMEGQVFWGFSLWRLAWCHSFLNFILSCNLNQRHFGFRSVLKSSMGRRKRSRISLQEGRCGLSKVPVAHTWSLLSHTLWVPPHPLVPGADAAAKPAEASNRSRAWRLSGRSQFDPVCVGGREGWGWRLKRGGETGSSKWAQEFIDWGTERHRPRR